MQKNTKKWPQKSEMIQVGCKWKLTGICKIPQTHPSQKLLSNVKPGCPRGRNDTPKLGRSFGCIKSALNEVVPVVMNEKDVRKPSVDDEMHKSRQLMDALDILDSNSELFLKLLRDPNSVLRKEIRSRKDLQEETGRNTLMISQNNLSESGTSSTIKKSKKHRKSLLEIMKSQQESPSKDDEIVCALSSVTVVEPNQKEQERRKLEKRRDLRSSSTAQMVATGERAADIVESMTVGCSNQSDIEAKRRLSRRLKCVEKSERVSGKESPRTLRRILSSPQHDFVASSCLKMETGLQMRSPCSSKFQMFTKKNNFHPCNEDISAKLNHTISDEALNTIDSDRKILKTVCSTDDSISDACVNNMIPSVSIDLSEMPSKPNHVRCTNAEENIDTAQTPKQYQHLKCSTQDFHMAHQTLISSSEVSSISMSKYKVEIEERVTETEEHLSPVSVLDSSFSEDATIPSSKINQHAKTQVQPVLITSEEESDTADHIDNRINICSCIRTVLQAFELNWKDLSENSRSSGQLLNILSVDKHDLFADFINDILLEVTQHNAECIIWSSFIRPDTQAFSVLGKDVVEEVMKVVHWYLVPPVMPRKLEHLVGKDMEKPQCWSGTRPDTEYIVVLIVDDVLDDLMMETIFAIEE